MGHGGGAGLDAQASREMQEEMQRHARAVAALTARENEAFAAEAAGHIGRVEEIMRDLVRRLSAGAPG